MSCRALAALWLAEVECDMIGKGGRDVCWSGAFLWMALPRIVLLSLWLEFPDPVMH